MDGDRGPALVAGAGGFIGGHLVARLLAEGRDVRAADMKPMDDWYQVHDQAEGLVLDLSIADNCDRAVDGVADVYNLASDMGGMGFIENNKALCMLSVLINTHLMKSAHAGGCDRYFFASSACIYPDYRQKETDNPGLKESDAYPAMPEDGYGWEKLFGERLCRHFLRGFRLPDADRSGTTTSTDRTGLGPVAGRRLRRRSAGRSPRPFSAIPKRSRSGATGSSRGASCTSTTASRAPGA